MSILKNTGFIADFVGTVPVGFKKGNLLAKSNPVQNFRGLFCYNSIWKAKKYYYVCLGGIKVNQKDQIIFVEHIYRVPIIDKWILNQSIPNNIPAYHSSSVENEAITKIDNLVAHHYPETTYITF